MTVPHLPQFQDRFFDVLKRREPSRSNGLSILMSDMKQVYEIPTSKDLGYERENPEVMHLYQTVSKSRNFKEVK